MKRFLVMLTAVLLLAGCAGRSVPAPEAAPTAAQEPTAAPEAAPTAAQEPTAAPEPAEELTFSATTLAGEAIDESYIKDHKLTMVNFWATWCPPCVGEMPDLATIYGEYADKGFGLLGVMIDTTDDVEAAKQFADENGIGYPLFMLPEGLAPLTADVSAIPTTIFLNAAGEQVGETVVGSMSGSDWRALIDSLLAGL